MKSTITRERLEQLASFKGAPVTRQEEQELARIALASIDAEIMHCAHCAVDNEDGVITCRHCGKEWSI